MLASLFSLAALTAFVRADWQCHAVFGKTTYDLTGLSEQTIKRERLNTPSIMVDELRFSLCKPLSNTKDEPDECPTGSYACLRTTNQKHKQDDRIVAVIPLAKSDGLDPKISQPAEGKLEITLHGAAWPSSDSPLQSFNVTLQCGQQEEKIEWGTVSESGASVSWKTKTQCSSQTSDSPPPEDTPYPPSGPAKTGSGIGWFFLILILAFIAYFGLGAYYNYNNYGASGWDLVPHRDFWREVPMLLRDVFGHLFSSVRGGRGGGGGGRGGYVSV